MVQKHLENHFWKIDCRRLWVHLLQSRGGKSHVLPEEVKRSRTYSRMLAGHFEALLQMLELRLRRQSSKYLTSPTDLRHWAGLKERGNETTFLALLAGGNREKLNSFLKKTCSRLAEFLHLRLELSPFLKHVPQHRITRVRVFTKASFWNGPLLCKGLYNTGRWNPG